MSKWILEGKGRGIVNNLRFLVWGPVNAFFWKGRKAGFKEGINYFEHNTFEVAAGWRSMLRCLIVDWKHVLKFRTGHLGGSG